MIEQKELIEQWKIACENGGDYDLYHFYTLFHWEFTRDNAYDLLQFFPEKEELVARLIAYKGEKKIVADEVIMKLVKEDVENIKKQFEQIDFAQDDLSIFDNLEYVFVSEEEFKDFSEQSDNPIIVEETIGDYLIDATKEAKRNRWLKQAYYGLTTTPQLVWYLFKPLYDTTFNPDIYFEIWRNSGDYYIGDGKVYILNRGTKA